MAESQKPPSRTADQFVVRFPDGMRDRIAEEAKKNNRSMNAEIVARLERSFEEPLYPDDSGKLHTFEDVERRLQNLARQMDLKLRLVKAQAKNRPLPTEQPPSTPKKTIPKK